MNEEELDLVDYKAEVCYCAKCGYPEEAHYNRGFHYNAIADIQGKYHFVVCKKFKLREQLQKEIGEEKGK
jgi:hypothetical protein